MGTVPLFRVVYTADGNFSHLGRTKSEFSTPEVAFDIANGRLVVSNPQWVGTITAANGDLIEGTYEFRNNSIQITPLGDFTFVADLAITSGTGRFKDATGQGTATGTGNILTMTFRGELKGSMSTVGSSKRN
jgi:hypothetical protein